MAGWKLSERPPHTKRVKERALQVARPRCFGDAFCNEAQDRRAQIAILKMGSRFPRGKAVAANCLARGERLGSVVEQVFMYGQT